MVAWFGWLYFSLNAIILIANYPITTGLGALFHSKIIQAGPLAVGDQCTDHEKSLLPIK
jgi:hypothetical protein